MSEQPPANPPNKQLPPSDEDADVIEGQAVESILKNVPDRFVRDTLVAILREGTGPKYDAETFKIAATTLEKDNDNKLTYLMKKLEVEDGQHVREHGLEEKRFISTVKLVWLILIAALIVVSSCIGSGIYLAAIGKETLGFSVLSATIAALFAYLGGLGTPRFWQK